MKTQVADWNWPWKNFFIHRHWFDFSLLSLSAFFYSQNRAKSWSSSCGIETEARNSVWTKEIWILTQDWNFSFMTESLLAVPTFSYNLSSHHDHHDWIFISMMMSRKCHEEDRKIYARLNFLLLLTGLMNIFKNISIRKWWERAETLFIAVYSKKVINEQPSASIHAEDVWPASI